MFASPPLSSSSSSSSSEEEKRDNADAWSLQIATASEKLQHVLDNLSNLVQDNLYLREVNAKLNGIDDALSIPPPDYNGGQSERETRKLLLEMSVPKDEEGLKELEETLKEKHDEMSVKAVELYVKNEEWREKNKDAVEKSKKNGQQQQPGEKEQEPEKEWYQDIDGGVVFENTTFPEESDEVYKQEVYKQVWTTQHDDTIQLLGKITHLDQLAQENRYLRRANAELNGHPLSPPPPGYNSDGVVETEARELVLHVLVPNDVDGVRKLIPKFKKSSEEMSGPTAELAAENEKWREKNSDLNPNWMPWFEKNREQWEKEDREKDKEERRKEREGKEEERKEEQKQVIVTPKPASRYEEDRNDDEDRCAYDSTLPAGPEARCKDLCITSPPEPEETYKDLCSAQVRAFDDLTCLLASLDEHIRENQHLRNVNAELNADPSTPPPDYSSLVFEAADEASQLLEMSSSLLQEEDEKVVKKELVQNLKEKFVEIDSFAAEVIGKNEGWKEKNDGLRIYGSQRSEQQQRQSEKKEEVVTSPGPAPRDHQDRSDDDDDLREQNRVLRARLLVMGAAMKDGGKTTRAAPTLRDTITPTPPSTKNVRAALVAANVRIEELEKAATAPSHHHLPCPILPELEKKRTALVAANVRICQLETAAPQSSHHLPCPIEPELESVRTALVTANARISELEKQVAAEPTPRVPCRTPTPSQPPPPELKTTSGSSAALAAANGRIVELEKQLAGAIAKTIKPDSTRALSSSSPKPHNGDVEPSQTPAPATTNPSVSEAAVDPEVGSPKELSIRRASLPSTIDKLKQQVRAIELLKPYQPSASPPDDPPPPPPPLTATQPLYFPPSASQRLPWLMWFFVLFIMLVGVFLCWIEWAGLNRERAMWLAANEETRVEVVGERARAWNSWDRVSF